MCFKLIHLLRVLGWSGTSVVLMTARHLESKERTCETVTIVLAIQTKTEEVSS